MIVDVNKYRCHSFWHKDADGNPVTRVIVAVSTYAGKTVKGYAKLDPRDEFDYDKGKNLAIARCNVKVAAKRLNRADRKVNEAKAQVHAAMQHLNKMIAYQSDSATALETANKNLTELLATM